MKNINFKKLLPHVIAIVVFILVAVIFCKPALEGKVLNQHDTVGWRGMAQQSFEVKEKIGHWPLWTNSMFGGMPAYQIALDPQTNISAGIGYFTKIISLGLPEPISFFFLACLCFYILCIVLRVNPIVAMLAALAYSYSTYDPVIISAGHNTKMISLAYMPMVIAGIMLLFQKKYLYGFVITALFGSILIAQNHLQIVYYTFIIVAVLTVAHFIKSVKENETVHALKASALGLIAGLIGLATCAVSIMPTYEYAKETMRGGVSQLTLNKADSSNNKTKGGLDKDYALKWSIGKMETFTFMVPGLYGGSNGGDEHSTSSLTDQGIPEENAVAMTNGYSYWGSMSKLSETTSGPVYLGAVICFLVIFSLFYLKNWNKWWLVAASIIGILLAWGSNFKTFNYLMLDYLPYYSKFRAPSMAMVIPQFCFPLLAALGLSKLIDEETDWAYAWKKFKYAAIATGVVVVILAGFYFTTDYVGLGDPEIKQSFLQQIGGNGDQLSPQATDQVNQIMKGIRADRKALTGGDLLRSILFIALALSLVALFVKRKINALIVSIGLLLITCIDLIGVDKRYINYDDFKEVEEVDGAFAPSAADVMIAKDPDHANFRVFNTTTNFTNESITSYHHNSIGGYSPAKLGLYQDLLEHQIYKNNFQVLNMLNTKYVIVNDQSGRPIAQRNDSAYGNCWLVKGIKFVATPNEEMLALDNTNLRDTAIVNNSFKASIKQLPQYDSSAFIKLGVRENDKITYTFLSATPQFAVLSEIYYSGGWDAYIDGQKTDYVKTNYALRGLYVPAGKHTIEFRFEPESFTKGRTITIWSTVLIYLLAILAIVMAFRKKK